MIKYTELWDKVKNFNEEMNDKPGKYEKELTRIKFDSDDKLPLDKIFKLYNLIIVVRSVFQEDNKYYLQIVLDKCLYELLKCSNMKELTFQKELK